MPGISPVGVNRLQIETLNVEQASEKSLFEHVNEVSRDAASGETSLDTQAMHGLPDLAGDGE